MKNINKDITKNMTKNLLKNQGAIAIFVKTPELSRVKTRLAAGIGDKNSRSFYDKALIATVAAVKKARSELKDLDIFWAVAEEPGLRSERWKEFSIIFQGDGGLGERLHTVYNELQSCYNYVAFIGADSPHVSSQELEVALNLAKKNKEEKFIIGETFDGGFYFFAGGKPLPKNVWTNVEYSTERTTSQLVEQLKKYGHIEYVKKNFDIDTREDFFQLAKINYTNDLLAEQVQLIEWARSMILSSTVAI